MDKLAERWAKSPKKPSFDVTRVFPFWKINGLNAMGADLEADVSLEKILPRGDALRFRWSPRLSIAARKKMGGSVYGGQQWWSELFLTTRGRVIFLFQPRKARTRSPWAEKRWRKRYRDADIFSWTENRSWLFRMKSSEFEIHEYNRPWNGSGKATFQRWHYDALKFDHAPSPERDKIVLSGFEFCDFGSWK